MKQNFHQLQSHLHLLLIVKVARVTATVCLERRNRNEEEEIEVFQEEIPEEDNTEEDLIIVLRYRNQGQGTVTSLVIQTLPDQDQGETDLNIIIIQGPVQGTSRRRSTEMMRRSLHRRQSILERQLKDSQGHQSIGQGMQLISILHRHTLKMLKVQEILRVQVQMIWRWKRTRVYGGDCKYFWMILAVQGTP